MRDSGEGEVTPGVVANSDGLSTLRDRISVRTKQALAERRAQGKSLGRPSRCDPRTLQEVVGLRYRGYSLRMIARHMTYYGVPTPGGRLIPWSASHAHRLLRTQAARQALHDLPIMFGDLPASDSDAE
jgi:hypothetical protein